MEHLTAEERAQLKELERQATPEPWYMEQFSGTTPKGEPEPEGMWVRYVNPGEDTRVTASWGYGWNHQDEIDAELIAAARNALPRLLAHITALEQERDALRQALQITPEEAGRIMCNALHGTDPERRHDQLTSGSQECYTIMATALLANLRHRAGIE